MAGRWLRGRRLARPAAVVTTLVLLLGCVPPPAPGPTAAPAKPAAGPTTASSPAAQPAEPAKPAAAQPSPATGRATAPDITLDLPHDLVDAGQTFVIRLQARSPDGVASMWWWATSTDDDNLADTHAFDCAGASPCRKTWSISTEDKGRIIIHAQARDTAGHISQESMRDLRVS